MTTTTAQFDGQALKSVIKEFSDAWIEKLEVQGDVLTFHDRTIEAALNTISKNKDYIPWDNDLEDILKAFEQFTERENVEALLLHILNWHDGRFVDYNTRTQAGGNGPDWDFLRKTERDKNFNLSQGRFHCLKWKDTVLFKTVYDLGIYQMMIWELKPKTIIEIGSGTGGSAIWMSDLLTSYEMDCKIISFDITPPDIQYKNVTFLKGDAFEIETALDADLLKHLPHPWLVIEDAHANVPAVLNYLHRFLKPGDYLNIEDSMKKNKEIAGFLEDKKGSYTVDTMYCDFFGRNLTCSENSIFRREQD